MEQAGSRNFANQSCGRFPNVIFRERGVGEDDRALETLLIIRWRPWTVGRVQEFEHSLQKPQKPRET